MQLTEIRINLCPTAHGPAAAQHPPGVGGQHPTRLRAFCSLTFDDTFVVRDVKLIEGNGGLFLAMPSRKLSDHCPACREKNHLRARYCNQCGTRLDEHRHVGHSQTGHRPAGTGDRPATNLGHGNGHPNGNGLAGGNSSGMNGHVNPRPKLHADVAHPINARCRHEIERRAVEAYWREVERSRQPGYVPPSLDHEDYDLYDAGPEASAVASADRGAVPSSHVGPACAGHLQSTSTGWQRVGVAQ
jgi:stage V sporulation protein G